jgi:tryptophan synthase alpha chain
VLGITGTKTPDIGKVLAAVARIRKSTSMPIAVGFGVKSAEQASQLAAGADAVVVGSALVNAVRDSLDSEGRATARTAEAVLDVVRELAAGVRARAGANAA